VPTRPVRMVAAQRFSKDRFSIDQGPGPMGAFFPPEPWQLGARSSRNKPLPASTLRTDFGTPGFLALSAGCAAKATRAAPRDPMPGIEAWRMRRSSGAQWLSCLRSEGRRTNSSAPTGGKLRSLIRSVKNLSSRQPRWATITQAPANRENIDVPFHGKS